MHSTAYKRAIKKRMAYYQRNQKKLHTQSVVFGTFGVIGFMIIFFGYSLFSDSSLGIISVPFKTCVLITIFGFVMGILGTLVSLKSQNEADKIQLKLDRISEVVR